MSTANVPTLCTYAGQTIKPAGGVTVDVRHQGCTHRLTCLVVNGNGPNLLGRDWLTQIKLDWSAVGLHHIENADFPHMFPDLFKDGLGKLKDVEAKLYVDKEAMPRCFKPRSVPFALRAKVDNELQRLQATGVIVPIEHSDWAAPIVPVLKTNGEVRICGDYKLTVNKAAKVDQYPIPNIDDLYSKLSGGVAYSKLDLSHAYEQVCLSNPIPNIDDLYSKLSGGVAYSKLDLSHAYEQVCLSNESQHLTTITTLKGLFAYTRLCYGVSSAPGIFQRAMEQIVQGLPMVAVYLDDILVSGRTYKEVRVNLVAVMGRLQTAGLRLRLEKCTFMQKSCVYLGHRLDAEGIHPTNEKLLALQQAPIPTCVTELRSYVGLVNYYHKFLKNVSAVLKPLYELLQAVTFWHWGASATCIRSIESINTIVESASSLQR